MSEVILYPRQHFRHGTDDADMWREVWEDDDYKFVPDDVAGRVVLDVGAGIGAFAVRCLDAGAARVVCVEPNPETAACCRRVLTQHLLSGRAVVVEAAAWSSSGRGELHVHPHGYHGQDSLLVDKWDAVPCQLSSFAALVEAFSPTAVKIDAEQSEYAMLDAMPDLSGVKVMWVEYHETRRSPRLQEKMIASVQKLEKLGFTSERVKDSDGIVYRLRRVA